MSVLDEAEKVTHEKYLASECEMAETKMGLSEWWRGAERSASC